MRNSGYGSGLFWNGRFLVVDHPKVLRMSYVFEPDKVLNQPLPEGKFIIAEINTDGLSSQKKQSILSDLDKQRNSIESEENSCVCKIVEYKSTLYLIYASWSDLDQLV